MALKSLFVPAIYVNKFFMIEMNHGKMNVKSQMVRQTMRGKFAFIGF